MNKPVAEEGPPRVRPPRIRFPAPAWLGSRAAVAAVLLVAAALLGGLALALRDRGSFSRRRIEFPPLPQLDAAIVSAQGKLRENAQDINALVELGTLHFEKGKDFYPEAINELEEARELGALDPRIFYCLGVMYQEVGLYQFALREYQRFLRHYPDDREVRLLAAKLLYKEGNFTEAVSEYERLKFHFPNDALVEENLGLSLWGAKLTERAVESFEALRSRGGEAARRASFHLGLIALEQGKVDEGIGLLEAAAPKDGEASGGLPPEQLYAALAQAYRKAERYPEAKAALEELVKILPGDQKALTALREVSRRLASRKPKK